MDVKMKKELIDIREGFERIKENGEFPNLDVDCIMEKTIRSLVQLESGLGIPADNALNALKEKYIAKEVS